MSSLVHWIKVSRMGTCAQAPKWETRCDEARSRELQRLLGLRPRLTFGTGDIKPGCSGRGVPLELDVVVKESGILDQRPHASPGPSLTRGRRYLTCCAETPTLRPKPVYELLQRRTCRQSGSTWCLRRRGELRSSHLCTATSSPTPSVLIVPIVSHNHRYCSRDHNTTLRLRFTHIVLYFAAFLPSPSLQ